METNETVVIVNGVRYYTLKQVCKELGYKTQKSFIEQFNNVVHTFKGIIAGKFVSVEDYNSIFSKEEEEEEKEDSTIEQFLEESDIPMDVKKKFAKVLVSKFHPDNNGDTNLFLWANKLKKIWEKPSYAEFLFKLSLMNTEDFLAFMETYEGQDKEDLMASRGYTVDGEFVF